MEFINIKDTKLKIILTKEECERYGIEVDEADHNTVGIRRAVREILSVAESECGFTVGSDKILVQHLPLPSGVCEILVTRLGTLSRRDRSQLSMAEGISILEEGRGVFRFESWEDTYRGVKALGRLACAADLYRDDLGRFYILADEELTDGISSLEVLIEFGDRLGALPIGVISEYGERLAKGDALDYVRRTGKSE